MPEDLIKAAKFLGREEEERLARQKAATLGLPCVYLLGYPVKPQILQIIAKEQAQKHKVVAYDEVGGRIRVATPVPENPAFLPFLKELAAATARDFLPAVCSEVSLEYFLKQYEFIKPSPEQLERIHLPAAGLQKSREELKTLSAVAEKLRGVSTTQILDIIFAGAVGLDASDIHLEPQEQGARLRYRLDGVLQDAANLPTETYRAMLNRIKFLAHLQVVGDKPQEGRIEVTIGDKDRIDIRVSVFPTQWGEAIVLRLLGQAGKFPKLVDLGFRPEIVEIIRRASRKPTGMIIICGPTGCGKTTTLYTILQEINKPGVKIITLEDPIEYRIPGIDQSQVDVKKNFTFALGLRSVLRQDPDVMMVGEIRDTDTAKIALQAAQTGHLLLTTVHANGAPAALPRLLDLGVEPYLLSGSINLILAQRLVRKVCYQCSGTGKIRNSKFEIRNKSQITSAKLQTITNNQNTITKQIPNSNVQNSKQKTVLTTSTKPTLRSADSTISTSSTTCPICNGTLYKGRVAVAEALQMTAEIEALISKKASVAQFEKEARREGMTTMHEDGLQKAEQGLTTKEEVERVTSDTK